MSKRLKIDDHEEAALDVEEKQHEDAVISIPDNAVLIFQGAEGAKFCRVSFIVCQLECFLSKKAW